MPDINIQYYKANDLIMAEYNPRQLTKDQYAQLKDSLTRFGLVDPLIVNKHKSRKNILVGGHQRLKIAKEMGMEKIPCVEVDLPLDQEKELNIRLNKNVGEWDYDSLANYFDVSELMEWGFSNDELQFYEDEPEQGLIDDDEIPEVEEAITKSGDIWLLGEHRVLCGDATKKADVEALMGGQKADMVFTDPPYNVDYGVSKNPRHKIRQIENDKQTDEEWKLFCHNLFTIIKDYNTGDIYIWGASGPDGMKMRLWLTEMGCHWSATIIWKKQQLVLSPAKYQRMYEPCFYGWFDKSSFSADRKQTEVWEFDRPLNSKLHPTMKPVELCLYGINNSSKNNAKIMDLFLGSGSTLIACEKTNRKCYGMEIDPHYCDVIVKRWEEFTGNKAERIERAES
jgi:DNA modification methylase